MEEGRIRVRAETSKGRRTRFVDLPLTLCEGKEMVKPEVARLMTSWLRIRSETCPQLREDDALFVTLGPNQWSRLTGRGEEPDPHSRPAGERIKTDAVRVILKRVAAKAGADPKLVTPHRLRHYFGLTSAMAGVPTTALMRPMAPQPDHDRPLLGVRGFAAPVGVREGGYYEGHEAFRASPA